MAEIIEKTNEVPEPAVEIIPAENADGTEDVSTRAEKRLREQLAGASSSREMLKPIAEHLIKRVHEDVGMASDVLQEHKNFTRMMDHIRKQARAYATGSCVAVPDTVVYEWAEDYIRLDDKELAEKAKKEEEERKAKQKEAAEKAKKIVQKTAKNVQKPAENARTEAKNVQKPKKTPRNEVDGQMSLFDLMED